MREIGVRELKAKTSEIMRNVRRRRTHYIITYRGRPVGLLSPLEDRVPSRFKRVNGLGRIDATRQGNWTWLAGWRKQC